MTAKDNRDLPWSGLTDSPRRAAAPRSYPASVGLELKTGKESKMNVRLFLPALALGLFVASGVSAASYTDGNLCLTRTTELRQDLKLLTAWSPKYEPGIAQLERGVALCEDGEKAGGAKVLHDGILALGLPPRTS